MSFFLLAGCLERIRPAIFTSLIAVTFASACSKDGRSGTPTSPTVSTSSSPAAPTVTVTAIEVAGPPQVMLGQTVTLSATARYSDGTSRDIASTAVWSTSDATIATVRAGVVTGVFNGTVSVTARVAETVGTTTINVVRPFTPGIVFGPGVSASDQDLVRSARAINEAFWGPLDTTILVYATIPEVIDAYASLCRCMTLPANVRNELELEAMSTTPGVMLVATETFRPFNDKLLRLLHSEIHAVQRGFTGNRSMSPVWMAEGMADFSMLHARASVGQGNLTNDHNGLFQEARNFVSPLREYEEWPAAGGLSCANTQACRGYYNLGHFALDLLTSRSGRSSLMAHWREFGVNLRRGMSGDAAWRAAFASTFGTSVDSFYTEFEAFRQAGFR